ncbi:amidohydrolase 2 [Nannochloropsis gaditana]|nr:amidohydrolase 2 [Nannochloropsis gaditana]
MDTHKIDVHVLVPLPWLEVVPACHTNKERALEACKRANNEMAAVVQSHSTRFLGVALLPTGHLKGPGKEDEEEGASHEKDGMDILMEAYKHAVETCSLDGVALFVGPLSSPLDHPGFEALWKRCEEDGVPVWLHPNRPQFYPDYEAYRGKGGSLHQIWNTLGWVYDTSVAMVHMVMAGVFQRYPNLKVVTHHHGGMIPFFTDRFITQSQNFDDTEGLALLDDMKKFYCDTATFGLAPLNIRQALEFFESGRVLFGTDTPMDMAEPGSFTSTSKGGVLQCGAAQDVMDKIWGQNFWVMMEKRLELKKAHNMEVKGNVDTIDHTREKARVSDSSTS